MWKLNKKINISNESNLRSENVFDGYIVVYEWNIIVYLTIYIGEQR